MLHLIPASEQEFFKALNDNPLAVPDGMNIVGSMIQTTWHVKGKPVARRSEDSFGTMWDVAVEMEKNVVLKSAKPT